LSDLIRTSSMFGKMDVRGLDTAQKMENTAQHSTYRIASARATMERTRDRKRPGRRYATYTQHENEAPRCPATISSAAVWSSSFTSVYACGILSAAFHSMLGVLERFRTEWLWSSGLVGVSLSYRSRVWFVSALVTEPTAGMAYLSRWIRRGALETRRGECHYLQENSSYSIALEQREGVRAGGLIA
jgi:hypothetical protein